MSPNHFLTWLRQHGQQGRLAGESSEVLLACPRCQRKKLYANPTNNRFYCQRCQHKGRLPYLLVELGRITVEEAQELCGEAQTERRPLSYQATPACPLPEGFISFSDPDDRAAPYEQYWLDRGFSRDLLLRYGVGYCAYGRYGGRLVVPVVQQGVLVHWIARDVFGRADTKVLTPLSNVQSNVLFNGDILAGGDVVICEGVFDALRLPDRCVATFGKRLSAAQRALLLQAGVKRVTFAWDADARLEAVRTALSLRGALSASVARLTGKDPAEMSEQDFLACLADARPPTDSDLLLALIDGV